MKQVVIVGAGISGLATAYRLQILCPDATITVLEANQRPGGTIWTERGDGFQVEIGPNGFLDNKPFTLRLAVTREPRKIQPDIPASAAASALLTPNQSPFGLLKQKKSLRQFINFGTRFMLKKWNGHNFMPTTRPEESKTHLIAAVTILPHSRMMKWLALSA